MAMQDWFQNLFANLAPSTSTRTVPAPTSAPSSAQSMALARARQPSVRLADYTGGGFDVTDLQRMFADQNAATPGWYLGMAGSDASQDGGLGATVSPFSRRLGGTGGGGGGSMMPSTPPMGGGSYGGGGGGYGGAGSQMPGLPAYPQPPANWQQMLPGAMPLPPLFAMPGAQQFGIGNYRTPDYAGLLGRFGR